jgi:hypothetical protein
MNYKTERQQKEAQKKKEDADHGGSRKHFAPFEYVCTVQCHWGPTPRM